MDRNFSVEQYEDWIRIRQISNIPFNYYAIYLDHQLAANFYRGDTFYLHTSNRASPSHLIIAAYNLDRGFPTAVGEQYSLGTRDRNFKPGDILVASDNLNETMTGYIGHSALVIDKDNLIESPGGHPAIRKDTIQQFLDKHPVHAQFRPRSKKNGKAAVEYATNYLKKYKDNLDQGIEEPVFSYNLSQSIEDPWEHIYCSKLIWLSYFHGASYKLDNDYLWYSPEDLYTNLLASVDFELIYEHEDVEFIINT
ncbi:hypothetical protein GH741_16520 [Aquibacillus halophilus]|uniref:Uncharacterized protein n=1 Tax=Aquibacillus halophilus TaxID=930132 RepID=A0A6A8DKG0_9BACI|nr:hypothetical protein [Aquibacillus halophilus]MRH44249.1 hypothetical protein [Aquibacillus halophilus]